MAIGVTGNTFQLNIVSAEGTLFSGPAHALAISGADGELGIRPGHSPLLSKIKPGVSVFVTDLKAEEQVLYISGGMVEVQPDVVTVLADTALHGKDIDRARAEEAKYAALENINKGNVDINFAQAQLELAKAVAQLRASELTSSRTRH
ncbi:MULTISPECIES: F0F1 ATP synthase subunit epsilon [Vibrio]|uniref:ATP synthase epsilon chain n=1 Tax=Vibrio cyclitrophicus TaxID=47951 RepID=A0A7Z1MIB3_9VIBR|nr:MULTISPECIES: F0F1 ATP synthase subunit epsilon [Vibrio]ERM57460.1 ATP synthase epsilon chain [Vibrio cyclitrophicus FF75]MBE8557447.1 F0F1 ATP synthase subunit epsilon [Vibrio sp. OPT24]MBU2932456.1 F0F1 ATP synthase subunit epsilon [Vibrio cyclitrophicus]MDH5879156.1 F0F1 ATP synthase subunit epsilon [Vibrio sp. S/42/10]NOI36457.1 F0F1 ATP synthase subunit epsilon [Vibrio cyclitrophicus]|tara:strand:- start:163 stop:606 length:444 start_codon:yes stop_codon:yes gene_type:complete